MDGTNLLIEKLNELNLWEKRIVLRRNDFLTMQGDIETRVFIVRSGSLRIFYPDNSQLEHTIRFGYPGSLMAALDSFFSGSATSYSIQAIKRTELEVISKAGFLRFIQSDGQYVLLWQRLLEQLICQQMEREIDLLTDSPAGRYQRVLERSPRLYQEIPEKYIASYLRMSPETLSRIKKS